MPLRFPVGQTFLSVPHSEVAGIKRIKGKSGHQDTDPSCSTPRVQLDRHGLAGRLVLFHGVRGCTSAVRRAGPQAEGRLRGFVPFTDYLRIIFLKGLNPAGKLDLFSAAGSVDGSPTATDTFNDEGDGS